MERDRAELEILLSAVQDTQRAFWNALYDLEGALGDDVELEGSGDYEGCTVDDLIAMAEKQDEDEEDE